jgi:type I restriction enzyme S subunit
VTRLPWDEVALMDLCSPKQWPTISGQDLTPSGFPVYGANGRIGFYSTYNHEEPTILVACRGATCGAINVCEPRSYVTGNAMALDDLESSRVELRFMVHALTVRGFDDAITGTAQPQITRESLRRVKLPLPSLGEQRRIADILDKADAIRRKRKEAIALTEDLLRSAFLETFGDPATNPKGWPLKPLVRLGRITTGNTPSRAVPTYFGGDIEWIKSDNINTPSHFLTRATECLSMQGRAVGRTAPLGSTLMTCIAGSPACIGNVALADREVAFNQQINAVTPHDDVDYRFLYVLLLVGKRLVQAVSTDSMKGMVSKGKLEEVVVPAPPPELQQRFGGTFDQLVGLSRRQENGEQEAQRLFHSAVQRAFSISLEIPC